MVVSPVKPVSQNIVRLYALAKDVLDNFGRPSTVFMKGWKLKDGTDLSKLGASMTLAEAAVPMWGIPYADGMRDVNLYPNSEMVYDQLRKLIMTHPKEAEGVYIVDMVIQPV